MRYLTHFLPGLVLLALSQAATASLITFTDRSAFESYVGSYTVDDFEDISSGSLASGLDRGDYSFDMQSYGCVNDPGDCGDSESYGFYYNYMWTYSDGSFSFDNPINAFGLDFAYRYGDSTVVLNGISHTVSGGGFLGIVDTTGTFSSVSYQAQGSSSLFDNVTYSSVAVPEPETILVLALSLLGLALTRRQA